MQGEKRLIGSRRGRRPAAVVGWLVTLAVLMAAGGCSAAGERADLGQALEDSLAAVRSVGLVVDLLQDGQTTRAAATVTAQDMGEEIGKAQRQLVDVRGTTAEIRSWRAQTQAVLTLALVAVQDTTDDLANGQDLSPAAARLSAVERSIEDTAAVVGER